MIQIAYNLYVGTSEDERVFDGTAIVNVAVDLQRTHFDCAYGQCGLIDGPGNQIDMYRAAVCMIKAFLADEHKVLVCCHSGSRALAVCIMFINDVSGNDWDTIVSILRERAELPEIHEAHRKAFDECKNSL